MIYRKGTKVSDAMTVVFNNLRKDKGEFHIERTIKNSLSAWRRLKNGNYQIEYKHIDYHYGEKYTPGFFTVPLLVDGEEIELRYYVDISQKVFDIHYVYISRYDPFENIGYTLRKGDFEFALALWNNEILLHISQTGIPLWEVQFLFPRGYFSKGF